MILAMERVPEIDKNIGKVSRFNRNIYLSCLRNENFDEVGY